LDDDRFRYGLKFKALAAGNNGPWNFMGFRRVENKFYVFRWFLQSLKQRIEGGWGKHVDLIDDVNFEAARSGRILTFFP
jgi:hypothetical protein